MKNKKLPEQVRDKIVNFINDNKNYDFHNNDYYGERFISKHLSYTKLCNFVDGLIPFIKGNQYLKNERNRPNSKKL